MEASHLETMVHDIAGIETFWEVPNKRAGVWKTEKVTSQYRFLLNCMLAAKTLKFDADMFTVTREKTADCMRNLLREQLLRLHYSHKKPTDEFGVERTKLTGKLGNLNDDLGVAVQMLLYWSRLIITEGARRAE